MQNDVKATNQIATLSLTFAVTLATILNIIFEPTPCTIYALAKIRSAIATLPPSAAASLRLRKKTFQQVIDENAMRCFYRRYIHLE